MKVRANAVYLFQRCPLDRAMREHCPDVADGQLVRVVNMRGAPPCNTMGMANIESLSGEMLGMCSTASLSPHGHAG